jgi:hypothetical protein
LKNYAILKPAVGLIIRSYPPPSCLFSSTAVIKGAEQCYDANRKAVNLLQNAGLIFTLPTGAEIQRAVVNLFGVLDHNHPFATLRPMGFRVTEPQITQGLMYFLDPSKQGYAGKQRFVLFLHTLLRHTVYEHLLENLDLKTIIVHRVKSELAIKKKRADIFLEWENNGQHFGVLIEAKFSHQVTSGQLPAYKQYLHKDFKDRCALILLTLKGNRSRRNRDWQPKSWFSLMTQWEKELMNDNDTGFAVLRQLIWNKLKEK